MTPPLPELWRQFAAGGLTKPEYIRRTHEVTRGLFGAADALAGTDVERLELTPDGVQAVLAGGVRFAVDRHDVRQPPLEAVYFRGFEAAEWRTLAGLVRPGMTVFDVGANVGWYTVRLAAGTPGAHVHAFEPVPHTHSRLALNVGLNRLANVTLHPFGLSDRDGGAEFFFSPESTGAASAANILDLDGGRRVTVRLRTLDGFCRETGLAPDLIKCDVEGGELAVVRGGREALRAAKPVVFLELLRKWAAKFGYHPNEVIELMAADGFDCHEMTPAGLRPLTRMADDTAATNFLFLHRDKHRELARGLAGG